MNPEDIAEVLRRSIREGVLAPGRQLVQDDLAKRFGVSRIPLREALRVLASEGLVVMHRGQGAVVTALKASEIEELYALRLAIEPDLAKCAAKQASSSDIDGLEALTLDMEEADRVGDRERWSKLNWTFHRSMYALSRRPHSTRIVDQLLNLVEPYSRLYVHHLQAMDRVQHEHSAMIETLRSTDVDKLAEYVRQHLSGALDGLLESMRIDDAEAPLPNFDNAG